MKIETNHTIRTTFKEIERGQMFVHKSEYYIKTEPILMPHSYDKYANAVRVRNGTSGYCFREYDLVIKLNAKVVIEE